mmetsp:Transcript_20143/g.20239  ORF Transcript_20143/g.20239 Transcript_20143/m.20239 type:complete len:394 (+) Transcript_20143:56-1237(+)
MMISTALFLKVSILILIHNCYGFSSRSIGLRLNQMKLQKSNPIYSSMKPELTKLIENESLTSEETEALWKEILTGADPVQVGALLVLLRAKGETPKEVAGMVRAMKAACKPVNISGKLLDIVGTGGDGADTINISTAAVILAAACGCKVAKAGNRSASSKCGSADVLEQLGVKIELTPDEVAIGVEKCGVGFMYAPINHPSMKTVAPIRKSLGVRTAFNLLGPLTNAANAQHVVIGVFREELIDLIGNTLIELGNIEHGVVVHSCGLDEVSAIGPTTVYEIKNSSPDKTSKVYETKKYQFEPDSVNIPLCKVEDLKGGDAVENAQALRDVLSGGTHRNAKRDSVVLNAGFGVYVYGLVDNIPSGVKLARDVMESGKALETLDKWITTTQEVGN